jgi:two-component sensor histidine kinase
LEAANRALSREIAERKQVEDTLKSRLALQKAVSSTSSQFVVASNLDRAINTSMAEIGTLRGASRVYLFRFDEGLKRMTNTHEWCAEGVTSQIDNLQGLPSATVPWWMEKLKKGEAIRISDVSELPEEASAEREILESQDIKSLLVLPTQVGGKLAGFVGFDNVMAEGDWHDDDLYLLRLFSEILGNALQRKQAEMALRWSGEKYRQLASENAQLLEQARQDAQTKATLLKEVNHRVKNSLSSIVGLLHAQERFVEGDGSDQVHDILEELVGRVEGLSVVHRMLSSTGWAPLELRDLVTEVTRSSLLSVPPDGEVSFEMSLPEILVTPDQASSLALVLNELVTNTVKHVLKHRKKAVITVRAEREDADVRLTYYDDGPGFPENVLRHGEYRVGIYLIQNIVINTLRGAIRLSNSPGARTEIFFGES